MNIKKQALLDALTFLLPTASKRTTKPILNYFALSSKNGEMIVKASDEESFALERIPCSGGDIEPVCVNADRFLNLVKSGVEEIELFTSDGKLAFKSGGKGHLSTLPVKHFPPFPEGNFKSIGVNSMDLARAIRNVRWVAPSVAEDKPSKELIELKWVNNSIRSRASDGKTVVQSDIPAIAAEFSESIHVRYSEYVIQSLEREGAQFMSGENHIVVQHNSGEYIFRKSEHAPLDFQPFFDSMNKPMGKIKTKPFFQAVSGCKSVVIDKVADDFEVEFGDEVSVSIDQGEASYSTSTEGKTIPLKVRMSSGRLQAALKSLIGFDECELTTEDHVNPRAVQFAAGETRVAVSTMKIK